ncbi:secreted RxLR effector protein 161-like [Apium graveolens]|uniref:secreted RxLR effector protein 161-like n=1 Tax=Apium graveolens TaxID=4045 RepID=UPI003D79FF60
MDTFVSKGDKFSFKQCPNNEFEIREMLRIPYASTMGSLIFAQLCTHPDISFTVGMLARYLTNPRMEQWKAVKRVLRYLKKTKDYMLTYRKSDHLEIIGYSDFDFGGCKDEKKIYYGLYLSTG